MEKDIERNIYRERYRKRKREREIKKDLVKKHSLTVFQSLTFLPVSKLRRPN